MIFKITYDKYIVSKYLIEKYFALKIQKTFKWLKCILLNINYVGPKEFEKWNSLSVLMIYLIYSAHRTLKPIADKKVRYT